MKPLASVVLLLFAGCAARESQIRRALTLDDVHRMAKAGVGDKAMVAAIETSEVRARLTIDDILSLKEKGLSDEVLAALIRATSPEPPARVVHHPYPSYYYYRGPVYAPYWW